MYSEFTKLTERDKEKTKIYLARQARKNARNNNRECTISPADIEIPEKCPIFGVTLVRNYGKSLRNSYSIDRVDTSKGYVPGNVKVISWWANYIKSNLTIEQVENLLAYMKGD